MSSGVPPLRRGSQHPARKLTSADIRCAGRLTTLSPTTSSSSIRLLSSTNAKSTVRSLPSPRMTSSAACVGKAPHGAARLPQVSRPSSPSPAPTRYTSSTVACSPLATSSLIRAPSSIFFGSPVCSRRDQSPSGRRSILGLRLWTLRWTLISTFWYLLSTPHHSRKSLSFYARCTGGAVEAPISVVWAESWALTNTCPFLRSAHIGDVNDY